MTHQPLSALSRDDLASLLEKQQAAYDELKASGLTGYSVLKADSLAAATTLAKGCPVLAHGGAVEVYEVYPVM